MLIVNFIYGLFQSQFLVFCSFRGTVMPRFCVDVFWCFTFCVPIRANLLDLVSQFYFWFFFKSSGPRCFRRLRGARGHELGGAVHVPGVSWVFGFQVG